MIFLEGMYVCIYGITESFKMPGIVFSTNLQEDQNKKLCTEKKIDFSRNTQRNEFKYTPK